MNTKKNISDIERLKIMKSLVKSDESKVILDIGGGLYKVSDGIKSRQTIILDGDRKFEPDILIDLNNPIPLEDNSIDIIIAGEIIEHLINPFRFLLECRRILKNGGQLILSTPNTVDLKSRFRVLIGLLPLNSPRCFPTEEDHLFFHKTDWTWEIMLNVLEKAGFEVLEKKTNGLFINKYKINFKSFPLTLGEKIILRSIKK